MLSDATDLARARRTTFKVSITLLFSCLLLRFSIDGPFLNRALKIGHIDPYFTHDKPVSLIGLLSVGLYFKALTCQPTLSKLVARMI